MSLLDTLQYSKLNPLITNAIEQEKQNRRNNENEFTQGLASSLDLYMNKTNERDNQDAIRAATTDGVFDKNKYLNILSQTNPAQFKKETEGYQKTDLELQKLRSEINKNKSAEYKDTMTAAKTELETTNSTIDRFVTMLENTTSQDQYNAVIDNAKKAGVYDEIPPQFKNVPFSNELKSQLTSFLIDKKELMNNEFKQYELNYKQYNDNMNRALNQQKFEEDKNQNSITNARNERLDNKQEENDQFTKELAAERLNLEFKKSAEDSIKNKIEIQKLKKEMENTGKVDREKLIKYSDINNKNMNDLNKELVSYKNEYTTMQRGNNEALSMFKDFDKFIRQVQADYKIKDNEGIGWIERLKKEAMPAGDIATLENRFRQLASASFMIEKEGMRGFGALSDKDVDQIKAVFAPDKIMQNFGEFHRNVNTYINKIESKIKDNEVKYKNELAVNANTQRTYKNNMQEMSKLLNSNNNVEKKQQNNDVYNYGLGGTLPNVNVSR